MTSLTSRKEDYSKWYTELVIKADLTESSGVRGCMIIKPYGFAIWEKMQAALDEMFKATGHENAYFPLFIPKSYLSKEAKHVKGFAKECAVVTHYRLINTPDGKGIMVDPQAKLEDELIIRPTSETIIWESYRRWIQSYRDLPLLLNQWANVVRWEMRTRLFLRTSEFLWQEGHTAHASKEEAITEAEKMLDVYADFTENFMAVPVIKGIKSPSERFAGAEETYCIEAMMQDGKALQVGTSHFLGQNFSKAFDVKFLDKSGKQQYVWATSWGTSTRLMGALVMTHSDDYGLVLPPKLAPVQVVIIPIYKNQEQHKVIEKAALEIKSSLEYQGIVVKYDDKESQTAGWKFNEYEIKGVPLRITIGPRDIEKHQAELFRRDLMEKQSVLQKDLESQIPKLLEAIQENLYKKALKRKNAWITPVEDYEDFKKILDEKGGFLSAHWDGTTQSEEKIKEETKATIRCIPLNSPKEEGKCIYSGKASSQRVLFARAY
ncbi:proline--tRNA ligase [Bacteroidetes bacterium endosymbiont of Geopemphigus sp.]|uniref:proline--tRNA ligase n=1 Tax=Bacteroidetes bacterium endosymbiont of Geopemphigus sp. TaxID=2047937 RepID=UPI000CD278A8|nr:proline--tRNA ligase [Bacteroidetes bacterium endosymbiont of Geopemphigus sp.]